MIAYHWLSEDMAAGEGNEPPWTVGEERSTNDKLILCQSGYHSSPSLYQALRYAPGPVACVVSVSEPGHKDDDKQVSQRRKLLAAVNVKGVLWTWVADCAERALLREREAGREPDRRSWAAIEVLRRYMDGQATDDDIRVAANAAYAAATYAATNASTAAYVAATAASYAATNAVINAANAAINAARKDEQEWQQKRFDELVLSRLPLPAEVGA